MSSYQYRKSYCGDKTVVRSSYLHNGIIYTGKMESLYWTNPLSPCIRIRVNHDDVIRWKHFPRHWPFVWGIHRSPVNSPHKGQWRGVVMFSLICAWINGWVNNREAGDLRRHRADYDVNVICQLWTNCFMHCTPASNRRPQNLRDTSRYPHTAPSHYLSHCGIIISDVLWY